MTATDVAVAHQSRQQMTVRVAAATVMERWRHVDTADVVSSWSEMVPDVARQVSAAQAVTAQRGASYVDEVVRAQGLTPTPAGQVRTQALAGVASDGRSLETLLALPSVQTVGRIADGQPTREALAQGRRWVGMLASTQVQDAGRAGASVGMVADKAVSGYRRVLSGKSCARCAILAGKFYRWNSGFLRHPQCDCTHVPAAGPSTDLGGASNYDPHAYFDSLPPAEQARIFTKDGAKAIREGADLNQVVNARRGMNTTSQYGRKVNTTTVNARGRTRLMPEQIYADATSRDDAIRLLRVHGYLS